MADPFLGEIKLISFNFAPKGWAFCNGQVLSIQQNTALFSLLGTYYGGNGQTTFALPNLQGQAAIHQGQGPGLSSYVIGQTGGSTTETLSVNQIPLHNHLLEVGSSTGVQSNPSGLRLAAAPFSIGNIYGPLQNLNTAANFLLSSTGGSEQHENRMPCLVLNYVIALQGIYPSRS